MPLFPKHLSCPVYLHLAQFSYMDNITFFHENTRRKLMCQPPCCVLIVFSLRFVNRNRLSDQCLVYEANGYLEGWMFNRSCRVDFLNSHFWAVFLTLNPSSRTSFTPLAKLVDRLLFCVLQLLRKGCIRFDVYFRFRLRPWHSKRFTSVSAYACFS